MDLPVLRLLTIALVCVTLHSALAADDDVVEPCSPGPCKSDRDCGRACKCCNGERVKRDGCPCKPEGCSGSSCESDKHCEKGCKCCFYKGKGVCVKPDDDVVEPCSPGPCKSDRDCGRACKCCNGECVKRDGCPCEPEFCSGSSCESDKHCEKDCKCCFYKGKGVCVKPDEDDERCSPGPCKSDRDCGRACKCCNGECVKRDGCPCKPEFCSGSSCKSDKHCEKGCKCCFYKGKGVCVKPDAIK